MEYILLLVGRILSSPISNYFQKKLTRDGESPTFIVAVTYMLLAICFTPLLALREVSVPTNSDFWTNMLAVGILDTLGNLLLVKSLQMTDLSVFGPLNAYKPVIALGISVVLLGEIPSAWGILGIVIIVAGSWLLHDWKKEDKKGDDWKALFFRIGGIALSATSSVYAKKAILSGSTISVLIFWAILGVPVMIAALYWQKQVPSWPIIKQRLRSGAKNYIGITCSVLFMQVCTILIFEHYFVGYSLAYFQLSAVVSVWIGYKLFGEKNFRQRLIGSIITVIGAIILLYS
jgi:drug/metabolite transporter (DMT)-like permease